MKTKDLEGLSSEELLEKHKSFKKELFDLNFQRKNSQVEKPGRFKMLRADIARILTILNERKRDGQKT
jgi:large subunit ribosomal protein L29